MTAVSVRALGGEAAAMIEALAAFTAVPGKVTRLFLTPEHRAAADAVAGWMREAGLEVREDAMGTVRGTLPPQTAGGGNRRLLIGSHIDTVVDAGRYDGTLGVVCAILAAREIRRRGLATPFAIEILAFGDEEGVRFPKTLLSSAAVAGSLDAQALEVRDAAGISIADALRAFGGNPDGIGACALSPGEVAGYLEVHIEQGPVLESRGLPLGVVTSIAGASRFNVTVRGEAGHAGTVPMELRHDALAAAAEFIQAVETIARADAADSLVATVGRIEARPGAVNVIPGEVHMTLDIRAAADAPRLEAIAALREEARRIGARRGCVFALEQYHDVGTRPCAPHLQDTAAAALQELGLEPLRLMSGAGHDGQAMAALCDIGMMFVRCRGGISHNPLESVSDADMGLAVEALVRWIEHLASYERTER
ncbi:allantoate amidohydrolase [Polymorphum gilvum]|uniref:Amidase, hydantoinase/carbamoylase family n=1 Tax=Polymorphum gilvum (strain LMG 25793 / CGMCC 1.9160 / SL003B-26A1) TaxID=991905 RepID=F2IZV6_POLGS|nr:allantoate amidohydrolase [Polymorphum gilvum]ADZ70682.1 Amidase, hydantoinase/carbamoylase family [Polymorphum gilvum SL003B-26A1]